MAETSDRFYDGIILENSKLNVREALDRKLQPESTPQMIWIELTNRCQLNCTMCLRKYDKRAHRDLPLEIIGKIPESVLNSAKFVALAGGGETLLHENFKELLLRITRPKGSTVEFITNGILLDDDIIETSVTYNVNVMISMNGATRDTHVSSRPGSDFDGLIEKIKRISTLKKLKNSEMNLGINYVLLRNNFAEIPDFIDLMADCGVDEVRFFMLDSGGSLLADLVPDQDPKVLNDYLLKARIRASKRNVFLAIPNFYSIKGEDQYYRELLGEAERYPQSPLPKAQNLISSVYFGDTWDCHSPWTTTFVDIEGVVKPCCLSDQPMGNLGERSFMEIWQGEPYRHLRQTINTRNMPPQCRNCSQYAHARKNIKHDVTKPSLIRRLAAFFKYPESSFDPAGPVE
ncbi:radical SAM protein [bacterium]|nr:radical SAM protein [candidate division CSSED10-310 bacterium]